MGSAGNSMSRIPNGVGSNREVPPSLYAAVGPAIRTLGETSRGGDADSVVSMRHPHISPVDPHDPLVRVWYVE